MDGIDMIPNFDSTAMEPSVLPVSFPSVLVNSTSGIAVGFKSNIPSFNFVDVCNLVKEYIKDGSCSTVIEPDFVTGGYYVRNQKELLKLMRAGVGRIKLRARHIVDDKSIIFTDVPFGKTVERLVKQINDINTNIIRNAWDGNDFTGISYNVDCSSRARVDDALYLIYKNTDVQYTYSADITVVKDGTPVRIGVWGIIEEWVKWRREVLLKAYKLRAEACKQSMREAKAFMAVVNDYDKRMELVRIIADSGRTKGKEYVKDNFSRDDVPEDLIDFVASRSLPSYHDGGKYAGEYARSQALLDSLERDIADIDSVIVAQMDALISKYGSALKRRTEVTNKDYAFVEDETAAKEKIVDNTSCYFEVKNGFLRKLRYPSRDSGVQFVFTGTASDTLIAFDNRGRILRVYGSDIPLDTNGVGVYIPRYCNIDESDDYKITWVGKLEDKTLMLLYKDGNAGFVDMSEWIDNSRNVKVLQRGISTTSAPYLGAVLESIPEVLFFTDTAGRVGWVYTDSIKRKDRTAKTRVLDLVKGAYIDSYAGMSASMAGLFLNNLTYYHGRLKPLENRDDFRGNADDFIEMF